MAIIVSESNKSGSVKGTYQKPINGATRTFTVSGVNDRVEALLANDIPAYGELYYEPSSNQYYSDIIVLDKTAKLVEESAGSLIHTVTVTYGPLTKPQDQPPGTERWKWTFAPEQEHIQALEDKSKRTTYGNSKLEGLPINATKDKVEGVDIKTKTISLTITKVYNSNDIGKEFLDTIDSLHLKVNQAPFPQAGKYAQFCQAGECQFVNCDIDDSLGQTTTIVYSFEVRRNSTDILKSTWQVDEYGDVFENSATHVITKEGHQHKWLEQAQLQGKEKKGIYTVAAHVDTHYDKGDFNLLGLSGPSTLTLPSIQNG